MHSDALAGLGVASDASAKGTSGKRVGFAACGRVPSGHLIGVEILPDVVADYHIADC